MPTKKRRGYVDARAFLEARLGPLTLGKVLWSIRKCDEMNQVEFARKLGISKAHLCDIEQGRKCVSPERAARFAKILGELEAQFVRLALQGILDRGKLRFTVTVQKAA